MDRIERGPLNTLLGFFLGCLMIAMFGLGVAICEHWDNLPAWFYGEQK